MFVKCFVELFEKNKVIERLQPKIEHLEKQLAQAKEQIQELKVALASLEKESVTAAPVFAKEVLREPLLAKQVVEDTSLLAASVANTASFEIVSRDNFLLLVSIFGFATLLWGGFVVRFLKSRGKRAQDIRPVPVK